MKFESRVWIIYFVFVASAVWDLTLTIWNLSHLGFHFEANPIARNAWLMILIKVVVCLSFLPQIKVFRKAENNFVKQSIIISGFLILTIGQLYGGYTHIATLNNYYQADQVISQPNGSITFNIHGTIVTYNVGTYIDNTLQYLQVIGLLLIYPYVYSILVNLVTVWVVRKKENKKEKTN